MNQQSTVLQQYHRTMLKYCSGCFKGDVRLLSCSICKTTFFCNIECQRACHKLHKKTCGPPNPGISSWNAGQCVDLIKNDYMQISQPGSKDTALALLRLYKIFRAGSDPDIGDYGFDLHNLNRTIRPLSSYYYASLWAAPGMTNFLLSHKIEVYNPNPNVQHVMNKSDQAAAEAAGVEYMRPADADLSYEEYSSNKSYEFAYILFYTLTRSATIQQMSMSEAQTRTISLRDDFPGAPAAVKRALELWMNENCGDAMVGGKQGLTSFIVVKHLY